MSLEGQIALITGASRGIGKQIALTFAQAGAHVIVSARAQKDANSVASIIRQEGGSGQGKGEGTDLNSRNIRQEAESTGHP